jgi:hypothetical protein
MFFMGIVLLLVYLVTYLALRDASAGCASAGDTWGCGMTHLSGRTEYTASGFSQPIVRFFKDVYQTKEENTRHFYDKHKVLFKEGLGEIHLLKFFEERLYNPVVKLVNRLSVWVAGLENWSLDSYVLYAFLAVLATIAYVGWVA